MTLLKNFQKDYKGKKILILGLGLLGGGVNDAALFAKIGAKLRVTDLKSKDELESSLEKLKKFPIEYALGRHRNEDILWADVIVRNPAIPKDSPFLQFAKKHNKKIVVGESLFIEYFGSQKVIGVTGTRGKTTTATWIYQLLKNAGLKVHLAGNIQGVGTLSLLEKAEKDDFIVLELSSWQLEGFKKIKMSPQFAVITSIYEDHLNRYSSMKEYIESKKPIFQYQTKNDFLIANRDQVSVRQLAREAKSNLIWFSKKDCPSDWQLKLKGHHNQFNAAAVIKVGEILNIPQAQIQKTITSFTGVPFRLERIVEIDGVEYFNDTTSTTPAAGIAALESFQKPIVLIAGGNSKNLNMLDFGQKIAKVVRSVIFLQGTETENLSNIVTKSGGMNKIAGFFDKLEKAIKKAKSIAKKGDLVLFSPGCTSFGMFKNEFDRGEQFNKIVMSLKNAPKKNP